MNALVSVVRMILFVNVAVFLGWLVSGQNDNSFMAHNFLTSWQSLVEGRYWTLLTSVFSHSLFFHFFINMYVLMGFGKFMEQSLGSRRFLSFYLIAGIVSSLSHCLVSAFLMHEPELYALGASGAIAGVVLLFSLMYPKEKILIFGVIPTPALYGALFIMGLDVWGMIAQTRGGGLPIGHGAHLGGAFTGVVYYFAIIRPRFKPGEAHIRPPV